MLTASPRRALARQLRARSLGPTGRTQRRGAARLSLVVDHQGHTVRAPVDAVSGLFVETLLVAPLALAWLAWLHHQGNLAFGGGGLTDWLLPLTGVITAVPLMMFAVGARRLPLATVGFLQYIAPSLNFLVAVLLFREPFDTTQLVGFALIWLALAVYSADMVRAGRRRFP